MNVQDGGFSTLVEERAQMERTRVENERQEGR